MCARQPTGEYLDEWAAGLRLGASTMASYRKNIRLHRKPYLGAVPLRTLTTLRIDAVYRQLEARGRRDHRAPRPASHSRPARCGMSIRSCPPRSPTLPRLGAWRATRPRPRTRRPRSRRRRRRFRHGPRHSWPRSWAGRCAWQPARRGRPVRPDHRRGGVMRPGSVRTASRPCSGRWPEALNCADVVSEGDSNQLPTPVSCLPSSRWAQYRRRQNDLARRVAEKVTSPRSKARASSLERTWVHGSS